MAEEKINPKAMWIQFRDYVSDVRVEMKRVTWPGKQEIYGTTVMVIITTIALGAYFAICDVIFRNGTTKLLNFLLHKG